MAPSRPWAPRRDAEPLLDEVAAKGAAAGVGRALAAWSSRSRRSLVAGVVVLGAGCVLAGMAKQHRDGLPSRTAMDVVAYSGAPMGRAHEIVSKSSGKCLNWGAIIIALTDCNATKQHMMWTYVEHHFEAFGTGKCLDLGGKDVHIWQCQVTAGNPTENHQHWTLNEGTGQLRHVRDGVCLAANGNKVGTDVCNATSKDQQWRVRTPPNSAARERKRPSGAGGVSHHLATLLCCVLAPLVACTLVLCTCLVASEVRNGSRTLMVGQDEDEEDAEAAAAELEVEGEPAEAERPAQPEQPPEEAPEEAPDGLRLDFQVGADAVRTVYAKHRPLGIRHGFTAPIVARGFTVNSYAKQELGVEEGWKLMRIGDEELHDNLHFDEIDDKLVEYLKDLELWPLPIGFKPSHDSDEVTTVEFREKTTGLEFTSAAPISVSRVQPGSPAEVAGVKEGWCVARVGGADVTQETDFHEFLGYFNEGVLPLDGPGFSHWLPL